MGAAVFGAAVELRGYHEMIFHDDVEAAVDRSALPVPRLPTHLPS